MSLKSFVSGLVFCCLASGVQADNRPAGYVTVCTSNDASCTLHTTTNVAFGRDNQFSYRVLSGTFVCNSATFGSGALADGECSVPGKQLRSPAQRRPSASNYGGPQAPQSDSST